MSETHDIDARLLKGREGVLRCKTKRELLETGAAARKARVYARLAIGAPGEGEGRGARLVGRMKLQREVFMLGRGFYFHGSWHYSGWDEAFATLDAAQSSIPGAAWVKDEKLRVWRTAQHDVIKRLPLSHAPIVSKRRQKDAEKSGDL